MSETSNLLRKVKAAFIDGRDRPPRHTKASIGLEYRELVEDAISASQLTPHELLFINSCAEHREEALEAARQGQLEQAYHEFNEVYECLQSEFLSIEGRLLSQTFLEPAQAYLCYKMEDYCRARELIFHAASLDRMLATEFCYPILSAHCLQLGHNLLRIHARLGEHGDVSRLAGELLDYLELRKEPLTNSIVCPRTILDSVPDTLLTYYFDKICGEAALSLAGSRNEDTMEIFQPIAHHANPSCCAASHFGSHAHAWMYAKHVALNDRPEAFLEVASNLLRIGRMSEPALWFATVVDVVGICRPLGPHASKLSDWIATEVVHLPDVPWVVKHTLGAASALQ